MIVYFHLSKNKDKKGAERPPESWIANWTREQLVERMRAEMEEHMIRNCKDGRNKGKNERNKEKRKKTKNQKNKKRKASSTSSSEIKTTESEVHSTSESETEEDSEDSTRTQSKKKKVIVEDSSPEQAQSYHGYSTL
ncbi:hypothetical protein Ahy_B02g058979 [Arachis hypogaea]|uniref:Uncharacterized protein n=1 Tax=Arachis hypogaea TaxID=3818 RepID=A0A445AFU0_ARAHY|nr:hypothetical protein Ahy_B02g058979 [Arachis hypogaea]